VGLPALAISAVSLAELKYGEAKSQRTSRSLALFRELLSGIPVLPFDEKAAQVYGIVKATLERRGQPIGGNDLQIASTAIAHDPIVVTRDVSEFGRVEGLRIEDWSI
jgi:tRNA(fMet)-specific endonuclease VapC